MPTVHAHLLRTPSGPVVRQEHERHDPKIAEDALLGGVPARAVLGMILQGPEGGKRAAAAVRRALQERRVTREQVTDTFGNARFRFTPMRFLKPELGEKLTERGEEGYRAFLSELDFKEDLPVMAKAVRWLLAKAHVRAKHYLNAHGTVVDVAEHEDSRKKGVYIPPAWTDVWHNPDPNGKIRATGIDAKGRKQYVYSAEHSEEAAAEKFSRLKEFHKELPVLRRRINAVLRDPKASAKDKDAAIVLTLIDRTAFRIGSDSETGAKEKAYGASTLQAEHVTVEGNKLTFAFTGKKGVAIRKTVRDQELAALIGPKLKRKGRLFRVDDDYVRQFLHDRDGLFKVKDFRAYHATAKALEWIDRLPAPTTKREFSKARLAVARKVAEHLGNTPAVALGSYIDPAVWSKWEVR